MKRAGFTPFVVPPEAPPPIGQLIANDGSGSRGADADQIGFEFGDDGPDVEEEPADGVVDESADAALHVPFG